MSVIALERHYSVDEVAELWHISRHLVTEAFRNDPGVLRITRSETRGKRGYCTLRIPESVVLRKHSELTKVDRRAA